MKIYLKVSFTYFFLVLLSVSILFGQPRRIEDIISKNASVKLHYKLALSAIYQKDFSTNLLKSTKAKRQYYNQLKFLSNDIEIDTLNWNAIVNVIIKVKKGSELNPNLVSTHNTFPGKDCDFVTATISIADLEIVSAFNEIIGIEPSYKTVSFLNETVKCIHANEVWIGGEIGNPLSDKITGKGVYVGIIDGQPNRDHETFKDKNGICRFNQFENLAPDHHGTFVAGIASGRGNNDLINNFRGIAYESNLLWFPKNDTYSDLDLFKQMIDHSGDLPLVVNCSRGTVFGPRDGTSFYEQALDTLINGNKIFIAAAANNSTRYLDEAEMTYMHFQGFVPNAVGEYLEIEVKTVDKRLPIEIWHTNNLDVRVFKNNQSLNENELPIKEGEEALYTLENSDDFISIYNQSSNIYPANEGFTRPEQNSNLSAHVISIQFNSVDTIFEKGIYQIRLYPNIVFSNEDNKIDAYICYNNGQHGGFTYGDNYQTICSPGCADKVITVAASRKEIDGGGIASYSSLGPLRNDPEGIVSKPDITAPGGDLAPYDYIFSASERDHETYVDDIGTSFAAPHVTGAIALLMECFPQLTAIQVKEILQKSAGNIPTLDGGFKKVTDTEDRKYWGSGKLDILTAYKSMAGFSYVRPYNYDEDKFKAALNTNSNAGLPLGPVNYNWESNSNYSYQKFTNGAIFLNNQETNAYWLGEGIWQKWNELNSVNSLIGLPLSSEFKDTLNNNNPTVNFRNGEIYWNGSEANVKYNMIVSSGVISNLEYFFDDDPGQGKGISINGIPTEDFNQSFDINYSDLSEGYHTLFIRAKDGSGKWGTVASKPFFHITGLNLSNISHVEYYIDDDPGIGRATIESVNPSIMLEHNIFLDLNSLNQGNHSLGVRVINGYFNWSDTYILPFAYKTAPIANAGIDQSVNEGAIVTLDGSASSDPDGDDLTYRWTTPEGTTLSSTTEAKPTFTAPEVSSTANYIFSLVVNDGTVDSPVDQVVITVQNVNKVPHADAGMNQSVNERAIVTLDGSVSSDPDGDDLTYRWTAPEGITLSSTTEAKPTFTAPEVYEDSTLTFSLFVNDGFLNSLPATVKVTVLNDTNVGVAVIESPLFKFYPNPTTGLVNLEFYGNTNMKTEVLVTNLLGAEIFRKQEVDAVKFQIDLSNQANGIYLLKVTMGSKQYNNIVVVRKE